MNELLLKLLDISIGDFIDEFDGYYSGIFDNAILFLANHAFLECSEFNLHDLNSRGFTMITKIELNYFISNDAFAHYIPFPVKSSRIISKEDIRNCYPLSHYYSLFVKRIPINNM